MSESRKGYGHLDRHSRRSCPTTADTDEFAPGREAHQVSRKTTDAFTLRSGRKLSASGVLWREVPSYDQKDRQFLVFRRPDQSGKPDRDRRYLRPIKLHERVAPAVTLEISVTTPMILAEIIGEKIIVRVGPVVVSIGITVGMMMLLGPGLRGDAER